MFKFGYKKVAPNEALIISGKNVGKEGEPGVYIKDGRRLRVVRGGTVLVTPFQSADSISLNSFQIPLKAEGILTKDEVPITVHATSTIKVADELESVIKFAEQFMGKKDDEISKELRVILEGKLRTTVAEQEALEVNNARENFIQVVQEKSEADLKAMGFNVVNFSLDRVLDADEYDAELGYLKNLGITKLAESSKQAQNARSDAERQIEENKATNAQLTERAKSSSDIEITRQRTELQLEQTKAANDLDLEKTLRERELNEQRAIAKQAYEKKQAELELDLIEKETQAKREREKAQLELKELAKQQAVIDAQIIAERDVIANDAQARIAERTAEADARAKQLQLEVENDAIARKNQIEIDAIREKGIAEAEAIKMKAEAMKEYGEAAIAEMLIKALPDFARAVAEPLASIDNVQVMDFGGEGGGVQNIAGNTVGVMAMVQKSLKETTGIDVKDLLETNASYGRNHLAPKKEVEHALEPNIPEGVSNREELELFETNVDEDRDLSR
ncbi:flotillin family protein [Kurthia massiliensis]|uniref:flotillin family protein n=1 Tax=Kurthia massiliensis TaxID=1033739 RepID=UPI000289FFBF|nr:SPFH domain-containing protein [Kurthia massiliensis]